MLWDKASEQERMKRRDDRNGRMRSLGSGNLVELLGPICQDGTWSFSIGCLLDSQLM